MEENVNLEQSQNVIMSMHDNTSWFGENAYRWPSTALPVAYAMACVEVASKSSERLALFFTKYRSMRQTWT
jgi:hypothetical protein